LELAGQGMIKGENDFDDDDDDDDGTVSDEDDFDSSILDPSMFPHACAADDGPPAAGGTA
jgi:hypothetical protein